MKNKKKSTAKGSDDEGQQARPGHGKGYCPVTLNMVLPIISEQQETIEPYGQYGQQREHIKELLVHEEDSCKAEYVARELTILNEKTRNTMSRILKR